MHEYNNGFFDRMYEGNGPMYGKPGSATPFSGEGRKLGVRAGTSLLNGRVKDGDLHAMRSRAAAAAMKRAGSAASTSSSYRLGGRRSAVEGMTPGQAAAQAAIRRAQDDLSCQIDVIEISDDSDEEGVAGVSGNDDKENANRGGRDGGGASTGPPNEEGPIVIDDSDDDVDAERSSAKRRKAKEEDVIDLCSQ